jgi:D-3-phosphoglycerate dehydrogenase
VKVFIADKLSSTAIDRMEAAGHTVVTDPSLKADALAGALQSENPSVLVVRSTKITGEHLDAAPSLELIVRAGAGVDTIDVEAASARGIFVANCPGKNADAVAELTTGLLLALDRSIPDNVADARAGRWRKGHYGGSAGLKGRRLAVIGTGNIGRAVIRHARALGMHVTAWSRSLTDEDAARLKVRRALSPSEAVREADAVTLHVASTPETKRLAGRALFEAMKPGAFFVNTTRGDVVDEDALAWAMEKRGIRAALDVFQDEPSGKEGELDHPLASHPSVYLTHHIGASTLQAQEAIAEEAARIVDEYARTGVVANCVNLATQSPATHLLTVRHRDRVGVLAAVLDHVRRAGWNVQEMENLIFAGAEAAVARIRFAGQPDDDTLAAITAADHVIEASVIAL